MAALLALAVLGGSEVHSSGSGWVLAPLGVVAAVPLIWRRRAPVTVWAVSGTAALAAFALRETPGLIALNPLIALYSVAVTSPRKVSLGVGAATIGGALLGVALIRPASPIGLPYTFAVVVTAACWLIGDNLRVRRAYVSELETKAARAEADRASAQTRAASQERARIARELHDVVTHHVSVIAVQAGAARMLAEEGAGAGSSRMEWAAVEETARQALVELRQLLGVLRHDRETTSLSPQPGLAQLDRLLDEVRRTGLPVSSTLEGHPVVLSSALDLSAYRIVQEALTNVMKHEGPVPTTVLVHYGSSGLEIVVTNEGQRVLPLKPGNEAGPGHGLIGMCERAAVLGGQLDAGPRPEGGFAIRAQLPFDGATR